MTIDLKTVKHISKLARISIEEKKAKKLAGDLNSIFDFIAKLNQLKTDNVEPLSNISSSSLPKREDISHDINSNEEILENAPDKLEGFFSVPKVVE